MSLAARVGVALLGGVLVLGWVPAGATSPDPSPRLTGKDLPTNVELASVYPELADGDRDVSRTTALTVASGPDCVRFRSIAKPSRAVWASYYDADGGDPYFSGGEAATPFVYEFATEQAAHRAITRLNRYLDRCAGSHQAEGTRNKLKAQTAPALGDESISYALSTRYFDSGTGGFTRREQHVLVRDGTLLVDGYLQAEKFVPSLSNAVRLAELTLASSS